MVANATKRQAEKAIESFFKQRDRNDFAFLYYSGHGIRELNGELFFATADTEKDSLEATSVSAAFVSRQMQRTRADQVVFVLDCCFSGAFSKHLVNKAATADVTASISAHGVAWMTATTAYEYAFEPSGEFRALQPQANSTFTAAIIEGLDSGEADLDHDGWISFDELYAFAADRLRRQLSTQTPTKSALDVRGTIFLARRRGANVPLPPITEFKEPAAIEFSFPRLRALALAGLRIATIVSTMAALSALHLTPEDLTPKEFLFLRFGLLLAWGSVGVAVWRALWSATTVDANGIASHHWRARAVTWPDLDFIQVYSNFLGKSAYAIRKDGTKLRLASPRTTILVRDRDFVEDVASIAEWHRYATGERSQTETSTRGGAAWATICGLTIAFAVILVAFVIQPWNLSNRLDDRSFRAQPCARWANLVPNGVLPPQAELAVRIPAAPPCEWLWDMTDLNPYDPKSVAGSLTLDVSAVADGSSDHQAVAHDQTLAEVGPSDDTNITRSIPNIGNEAYEKYCTDHCGIDYINEDTVIGRKGNVVVVWRYKGALAEEQVAPTLRTLLQAAMTNVS